MYYGYFIRRSLAIVPTLLALSLIMFFLKTYLPEGLVDRYLNEAQLQNANITQRKAEDLAKEIRADLNLDKPIFYFSIRSSVLPDSLRLMYPGERAVFFRSLLIEYGCIEETAAYFRQVLAASYSGAEHQLLANRLYTTVSGPEVTRLIEEANLASDDPLKLAFTNMKESKSLLLPLIPAFRWHGIKNQFHIWIMSVLTFEFGRSIVDNQVVINKIGRSLVNTLYITLPAFLILLILGIAMGVWLHQAKERSKSIFVTGLYGLDALPIFWLSLLLIMFFASQTFLNIFPAYGLGAFQKEGGYSLIGKLPYLVLPVSALVLSAIGYIALQVMKAVADESDKLYVTSARARGFSESSILWGHMLKNSMIPIITIYSGYLTAAFAGSLVVEVIFSIPGMGKLLYDSVLARDYNVVIGLVLIIALIKMVSNLIADMSYKLVNPSVNY